LPPFATIKDQVESGQAAWILSDPLTQYAYFSTGLISPARQPDVWQEAGHFSSTEGVAGADNFFTLFHYVKH
jgi:hypothetical protein